MSECKITKIVITITDEEINTDYFGKGASLPQDIADRANEELAKAVKLIEKELKEQER